MSENEILTRGTLENPVAEYIVDAALVKIEKIVSEFEQCFAHMEAAVKTAELAITGFTTMTDRVARDTFLLSSTITSLSSDKDDRLGPDSASISSIEFNVLLHEIAELRARLSSLEQGGGAASAVAAATPPGSRQRSPHEGQSGGALR
jgi:hypothetical protein